MPADGLEPSGVRKCAALWSGLALKGLNTTGVASYTQLLYSCCTYIKFTIMKVYNIASIITEWGTSVQGPAVGVLSQFSQFHYFPTFSESPKHRLHVKYSLRNSTQHIGGHSVHQWAYLWWSGINFGGPKKYAITKKRYNHYFTR